jgi:hypothetical protein
MVSWVELTFVLDAKQVLLCNLTVIFVHFPTRFVLAWKGNVSFFEEPKANCSRLLEEKNFLQFVGGFFFIDLLVSCTSAVEFY